MYSLTVLEARNPISIMGRNQGVDSAMLPRRIQEFIRPLSLKASSSSWLSLAGVCNSPVSQHLYSLHLHGACVCVCFSCSVLSDSLRPDEV